MEKEEKTYAKAIQELQICLDKIESGKLDIDLLSEEIAKASKLIKYCKDKLYKADAEIKKVLDNLD